MKCNRCLYSSDIPAFKITAGNICNYCVQHHELEEKHEDYNYFRKIVERIRKDGKGKPYDVVVGVSGGCDSSYMLYLTKRVLGLRPLAAHFDNTWDCDIAKSNLKKVISKLDVDLYDYAVDAKEFDRLFKSFICAHVPDIDTPSDIGLAAVHYMAAQKHGIKWIFEGHNFRTEGISPYGWFYIDARYIETVYGQMYPGEPFPKTFPNLWFLKWMKWMAVDGIKKIRPLYYINYNKEKIKEFLTKQLDWEWYGGHHQENRTAYFTNRVWLPQKFGIDPRICEFSALIRSGQMTRERAERILREEPMPAYDPTIINEIKSRLNIDPFDFIKDRFKNKDHTYFRTYKPLFERLAPLFKILAKRDLVPYSFYAKYTKKYDNR